MNSEVGNKLPNEAAPSVLMAGDTFVFDYYSNLNPFGFAKQTKQSHLVRCFHHNRFLLPLDRRSLLG